MEDRDQELPVSDYYKESVITGVGVTLLLVTIGIGLFIFVSRFLNPDSIPVTLEPTSTIDQVAMNTNTVFIEPHLPSTETIIESSIVAEKVDLQRKLIIPESDQDRQTIERIITESGGELIQSSDNAIVAQFPKDNEEVIAGQLKEEELTESVEVDYPVFMTADLIDWSLTKIEVPPVWTTTQASGVTVAVIDSGIDYNHPDLAGRYRGGYDFVNDDTDPYDDNGHGTHVAGIIAANANDTGIRGAASEASLVGLKVLAADGVGYVSDIIEAVDWAIQQDVDVVNFSLGTTYNSGALESKLQQAQAQGLYVVAAAGNTSGGSLLYPAAYDSVISVAATDQNDNFASFSSIGAELSAPGVAITSTIPGGGYATWSGTSMAAPYVSSSVALMIANNQQNIRQALQDTALDLGYAGKDAYFGYGRIITKPAVLGEDVLAPVVTFLEPKNRAELLGTTKVAIDVQDENIVETVTLSANNTILTTWTESPYELEWDTSPFIGQDVTLIVSAVDDSGNVGAAQMRVSIVEEKSPSPSASASASPSSSIVASPSPTTGLRVEFKNEGASDQVRQDIENSSQERRQEEYRIPTQVPEVSNINQRNKQSEQTLQEQPQASESRESEQSSTSSEKSTNSFLDIFTGSQEKGKSEEARETNEASTNSQRSRKPDVKGASTEQSKWQQILIVLRYIF